MGGFRAGRWIDRRDDQIIHDGPMQFASGEYHVASGRVFVHARRDNYGAPSRAMSDSFNSADEDLRRSNEG